MLKEIFDKKTFMKNPTEDIIMKGKDINKAFREQANKMRSKWRKVVTGNELKRIRDHIRETEEKPQYVKLFDKIAFTLGVLNIAACQYFLLNTPEFFWLWYSVIIPVLMLSRFYHFRTLGWQYFMIDFCYFTLVMTLANIFLVQNSPLFFKVCFIYANGPLMVAILIWRNSFIFHDYDKIVSVYIHLLPSMLYYTLRWHSGRTDALGGASSSSGSSTDDGACFHNNCTPLTLFDYAVATGLYFVWQVLYILKTEVLDKQRLDTHPELLTSLRWMSGATKNSLARAILTVLRRVGVFGPQEQFCATSAKTKGVFVLSQLLVTVVAFLPTPLFYYSSSCHLLFIVFIFTVTIFNGASFYIEVFSKRYSVKIGKIEEMHRIATQAQSMVHEIASINKQITIAQAAAATPPMTPVRSSRAASRASSRANVLDAFDAASGASVAPGEEVKKGADVVGSSGGDAERKGDSPPLEAELSLPDEEERQQSERLEQAAMEAAELEAISRDLQRTSDHALAAMRGLDRDLQFYLTGSREPAAEHPLYGRAVSSTTEHLAESTAADGAEHEHRGGRIHSDDSRASSHSMPEARADGDGSTGLAESAAAAAAALKTSLRAVAKIPAAEDTAASLDDEEGEDETLRLLMESVDDCDDGDDDGDVHLRGDGATSEVPIDD